MKQRRRFKRPSAQPEVRTSVYRPAYWDARRRYVDEAQTSRGEGLVGVWTNLASEVHELVAYDVLPKQAWVSYFHSARQEIEESSDVEIAGLLRDPDQRNACLNGLTKLIATIPER